MTARDKLLDLAARAEAATGADWQTDAEIALANGWETRESRWSVSPDWRAPGKTWEQSRSDGDYPPAFTASLDAALTLVPEGLGWKVGTPAPGPGKPWAEVFTAAFASYRFHANGATPALALTAAALRARAEEMTDEGC